ncbi:MAG: signal peptidase I [Desulfovibrionaceae bacterium]|nr:signal peptidase I [Desulfovibrionaceae bacterium]
MTTYLRDNTRSKRKKPLWQDFFEALVVALLLALIIRTFIVQPFKIPSESMKDTLLVGDQLLATKFDYGLRVPFTDIVFYEGRAPQRGEIIILKYPRDPDVNFIKRVVGVPGDVIEMRNKQFYRNGEPVHESYIRVDEPGNIVPVRDNFGPVTVPPDNFFVMGDNRDNSMDSRFWGFVERKAVIAKARRIYWSWESLTNIRWSRIGSAIE